MSYRCDGITNTHAWRGDKSTLRIRDVKCLFNAKWGENWSNCAPNTCNTIVICKNSEFPGHGELGRWLKCAIDTRYEESRWLAPSVQISWTFNIAWKYPLNASGKPLLSLFYGGTHLYLFLLTRDNQDNSPSHQVVDKTQNAKASHLKRAQVLKFWYGVF